MLEHNDAILAVSGKYWVGEFGRSILSEVRRLSRYAKNEVQISVYSFGKRIPEFSAVLEDLLQRNIRVQIIINRFHEQPKEAKEVLLNLNSAYNHLTLMDFKPRNRLEDLHAKVIVADRNWALIGSPNISWHGYISNHEIALSLKGEIAGQLAELLDKLAQSQITRKVDF